MNNKHIKIEDMDFDDYKKHNHFTTPEDYFDNLSSKIKENTSEKSVGKRIVIPFHKITAAIGYAAMIAIAAITVEYFVTLDARSGATGHQQESAMIEGLDDSDFVDNMLASYPIDEYTFYSCLTGEEE